jgi:hypothetical protein
MATINPIIEEADKFVDQWTKGEVVVVKEKMENATYRYYEGKDWWGRPKKHVTLFANEIGYKIATYQYHRGFGISSMANEAAYELITVVQRAKASGLLKDLKQQQRDYEQEIESLKERLDSCQKLNEKLVLDNKRLHILVDKNVSKSGQGGTEIGDIKKF